MWNQAPGLSQTDNMRSRSERPTHLTLQTSFNSREANSQGSLQNPAPLNAATNRERIPTHEVIPVRRERRFCGCLGHHQLEHRELSRDAHSQGEAVEAGSAVDVKAVRALLRGTQFTDAGVKELRAALPKCRIVRER